MYSILEAYSLVRQSKKCGHNAQQYVCMEGDIYS